MPATPPPFQYGGQALLEGVMIRARTFASIACRTPDGSILEHQEHLAPILNSPFARLPLVRGVFVLWETLVLGTRSLMFSANVQAGDEDGPINRATVIGSVVVSLLLVVAIFFLGPTLLAAWLQQWVGPILVHVVENAIQLSLLIGYMILIGRTQEVHRVFQYHGAEHMTIHAWEKGDPLTVDEVRKYPTAHPRCGTSFLLLVFIISFIAFSLVGTPPIEWRILSRVLLIPVVAGVSYEVLKLGARHETNPLMRLVVLPGLWLQMITTKRPDDQQIEVAIAAMDQALRVDAEAASQPR